MARKPTGRPVGPPKKVINWELFEQLCGIQCTQSEIASMLKVHPDTLRDNCPIQHPGEDYSSLYKKYSEVGKTSLRRYQFIQAKTKPNMAIWLGKQWLGQKENVSELRELVIHELRAGIKELSQDSGSETASAPGMENRSSLSDR